MPVFHTKTIEAILEPVAQQVSVISHRGVACLLPRCMPVYEQGGSAQGYIMRVGLTGRIAALQ